MRKISAIILSLILIMSTLAVLAIPASAEDAKVEIGKVAADYKPAEGAIAVNTAEEFAAMAADGNYYLAANIEINATYETDFTGTFDGCGKIITTSVSIFKTMNGTFKNATINGKIEKGIADKNYAGSVTAWPTGEGVVIDNVCNNASVTADSTGGGIVGYAKDKSEVTITNCVNNGDITSGGQTGGIVGYSQGKLCTVKNCVNTGKITATSSYGAGIVGRFGKDASEKDYVLTIENCVNTGAVESTKDQSAGIIGYIVGIGNVKNCVNKGEISNKSGASGGILGQTASDKKIKVKDANGKKIEIDKVTGFTVDNCVNYGKITGTSRSAGIAASLGRADATEGFKFTATNCINFGEIVLDAKGASTKGTTNHVGGVVAYAWGGSTDNATTGNINFGNITVKASEALENQNDTIYVAGVLGYVNSSKYHIKNNANLGTITVENVKNLFLTQIFFNNHADGGNTDYVAGNSTVEVAGEGVVYEKNGTQAVSSTVFTAEQVASGALAADYNEKAGKKVLYQEVGKDSLPTITPVVKIDKDGKEVIVNDVIKGADGKVSNPTYVPGGSTPTPTPTPTATGDSTVIMIVVFALATVAGLALVFVPKKKEN